MINNINTNLRSQFATSNKVYLCRDNLNRCESLKNVQIEQFEGLKNDKMAHKMGEKVPNRLIKVYDTIKQDIRVAENRILKRQIGIFYAVYEIKCVKNLQLNVFKCVLTLLPSLRLGLRTIYRQFEPILPLL